MCSHARAHANTHKRREATNLIVKLWQSTTICFIISQKSSETFGKDTFIYWLIQFPVILKLEQRW